MITIIVAADDMMGIGREGKLPWRIREEMLHFRRTTINNVVIMGRKTHESIGSTLAKRLNIVLTRDRGFMPYKESNAAFCKEDALEIAREHGGEIFIIGGAEIYDMFLEDCDRMLITRIKGNFDCDKRFPVFHGDEFVETIWDDTHSQFTIYELKRK